MNLYRLELGSLLRNKRKDQGMTMRDLATAVPISLSYLSEIESGVKEVSSDLLERICISLDTSIPDLLVELGTSMKIKELV